MKATVSVQTVYSANEKSYPYSKTLYKRPLSDKLIAFSSVKGKSIFKSAMNNGCMENFFPLSEQFTT